MYKIQPAFFADTLKVLIFLQIVAFNLASLVNGEEYVCEFPASMVLLLLNVCLDDGMVLIVIKGYIATKNIKQGQDSYAAQCLLFLETLQIVGDDDVHISTLKRVMAWCIKSIPSICR